MISKLKRVLKDERGITGLETAIILVAFVVVAAVFSFAVLSAGTYSTQKSEEAVYAGLEEVRSTLQLKGTIYAVTGTFNSDAVESIILSVANVAGGEPVNLTTPTLLAPAGTIAPTSTHRLVIDYLDERQRVTNLPWEVEFVGYDDGDVLLEVGEMAQITVPLTHTAFASISTTDFSLVVNPLLTITRDFVVEVKPERGAVLVIEKRTPGTLDAVMPLD